MEQRIEFAVDVPTPPYLADGSLARTDVAFTVGAERTADGARLRAGLSETVRERDALARELAAVRGERDELLEARRALEKIHEALSQASSRLG
jgi:hypothetical protein